MSNRAETIRKSLTEIFNSFKKRSPNKEEIVDLKEIEAYFSKMKKEKKDVDCDIFENKIKSLPEGSRIMTLNNFLNYFGQNVSDRQHFQDVFAAIDKDGSEFISKKELKEMIRRLKLQYTERDVNLMIQVVSNDGQRVSKQELIQFLCGP